MKLARLYARMLRLYPDDFYTRFGDEMLAVFMEAETNHSRHRFGTPRFALHEFGGLLLGILHERWLEQRRDGRLLLFRWRLMVPLLLIVSVVLACVWSLSYWGYIVRPASIFDRVDRIDSVTFARFDANLRVTPIPLTALSPLGTDNFPPSWIAFRLTRTQPGIVPITVLDPALAEQLTAALAARDIDTGYPPLELPRPMRLNPNGCDGCYFEGIALQPDGSLLTRHPLVNREGAFTGETETHIVDLTRWDYYLRLVPAGYIVEGQARDGTPLVFVSLASNRLGGDRFRYYEFLFQPSGGTLVLRDSMRFRFDVAGLEGMYVPVVAFALFAPLFLVWLALLLVATIATTVRKRFDGWRGMGRA